MFKNAKNNDQNAKKCQKMKKGRVPTTYSFSTYNPVSHTWGQRHRSEGLIYGNNKLELRNDKSSKEENDVQISKKYQEIENRSWILKKGKICRNIEKF